MTGLPRTSSPDAQTAAKCQECERLRDEIERRAAENARLQDGLARLVSAIYAVYEQVQGAMRKPSPHV